METRMSQSGNKGGQWQVKLVRWFERENRPMPWRSDPSPYKVWISEVMLQQTQVATVIPYFDRFVKRFPSVRVLAESPLEDVLRLWEGLGYYSRARNLHAAARWVMASHGGVLPETSTELMAMPGVGLYTAAAIASIAFGEPVPVVDGNVLRVFARFWGIEEPVREAVVAEEIRRRLKPVIRHVNPSHFNQAMMEIGALICRPRNPKCEGCVLAGQCVALRTGRAGELPVMRAREAVPHYDMAAGVIWKKGKILVARRPEKGMLGGLWEFPGGRRRGKESLACTVARAVREEAGLVVKVGAPYLTLKHAYSHFSITLTAYRCEWVSGRAIPVRATELRWIGPEEVSSYPMPRANRKIAGMLMDA
jgi:A/G-specific adenine glycosylase